VSCESERDSFHELHHSEQLPGNCSRKTSSILDSASHSTNVSHLFGLGAGSSEEQQQYVQPSVVDHERNLASGREALQGTDKPSRWFVAMPTNYAFLSVRCRDVKLFFGLVLDGSRLCRDCRPKAVLQQPITTQILSNSV
jgi:hypothetical protein